jgi:hypothetical protein
VQQARLATAPTFVRPAPKVDGLPAAAEDAAEEQGASKEHGKYGRQLARFETMIQHNSKHRSSKKELKVRDTPPVLPVLSVQSRDVHRTVVVRCAAASMWVLVQIASCPIVGQAGLPFIASAPAHWLGMCVAIPLQEAKKAAAAASSKLAASKSGKLIVKEDQEEGQVTGKVYWQYIVAYGVFSFIALILLWSSEQVGEAQTGWMIVWLAWLAHVAYNVAVPAGAAMGVLGSCWPCDRLQPLTALHVRPLPLPHVCALIPAADHAHHDQLVLEQVERRRGGGTHQRQQCGSPHLHWRLPRLCPG